MAGYLFAHFIREQKDGEQVYFSLSKDGLHWKDLYGGKPVLISKVGEKLSTGKVYSDFDTFGSTLLSHDHKAVINALKSGDNKALANSVFNDFESVVFASSPEVRAEKERLLSCGALNVCMSGAGPTLVAFFDNEEKAKRCGNVYKILT